VAVVQKYQRSILESSVLTVLTVVPFSGKAGLVLLHCDLEWLSLGTARFVSFVLICISSSGTKNSGRSPEKSPARNIVAKRMRFGGQRLKYGDNGFTEHHTNVVTTTIGRKQRYTAGRPD
jgi:hypothetical protein